MGTAPKGVAIPPNPIMRTAPNGVAIPPNPIMGTAPNGVAIPPNPIMGTAPKGVAIPPNPIMGTAPNGVAIPTNPIMGTAPKGVAIPPNPIMGTAPKGVAIPPNPIMGTAPNGVAIPPNPTTYSSFQPGVFPPINLPLPPAAVVPVPPAAVSTPNTDAFLKRHRNPPPTKDGTDHHVDDSENIMKRVKVRQLHENSVHINGMVDLKQEIPDEVANNSKKSTFTEVTDPVQCRSIRLSDPLSTGKIAKLHYANLGSWLLALDTNGKHKLWKWKRDNCNPCGKATAKLAPELWQPADGIDMRNDTSDRGRGEVDSCMALAKNSSYLISCSGGKVSLFKMVTFEVMAQFGPSPPAATFLAFHPKDSNITAIGMDDATIKIYNCRTKKITWNLKGHQKGITGLAFSEVLNVLVSSGADAQLCVWGINEWEKQKTTVVHSKAGRSPSSLAHTRVEFHKDEVHLLVVQDSQIAIYDAYKLECMCHWAPQDPMIARISSATYSCDSLLVYASFCDGSVGVFDAEDLKPRCCIAPSAFMPGINSGNIYPLAIAAHPLQPNQFALGMTDGGVHVIEPAEPEGKWGAAPSDKGVATSNDTIRKSDKGATSSNDTSSIEMEK